MLPVDFGKTCRLTKCRNGDKSIRHLLNAGLSLQFTQEYAACRLAGA
jgi:hypothetical protein